jgi:predicted N-acetyltransferase YhbS
MAASSLFVRPLNSPEEYAWQFHLANQAFSEQPSPEGAQRWQHYLTNSPEFQPEQLRGAFRDDELLGGYLMYERLLRMGAAAIPTGCIGIVVTHPAHRRQGVAAAMMQDAITFARSRGHALLLLDGIATFYHRYGYTDVLDLSVIDIKLPAVLAQPQSPYSVRLATSDDAEAVLALYQRHHYPYTGSFERSLQQQRYRLYDYILALAPGGQACGYLHARDGTMGNEMAADDWEAMLALLQHHAHSLGPDTFPATLRYRLPLASPMLRMLMDHLEVPDASHWRHPAEEWVVKSETYHHRDAGWMARCVHLPTLMAAMLPQLQARWQHALAHWTGTLHFLIGDETCALHIDETNVRLDAPSNQPSAATSPSYGPDSSRSGVDSGTGADVSRLGGGGAASGSVIVHQHTIQLTPQAFTQLIFGYHPVSWAIHSGQNSLPGEVLAVLTMLFPPDHAWIARSDWF